jgi:hypothetical protein
MIQPVRVKEPHLAEQLSKSVAEIALARKKERQKTLTRNFEVCDLLDIRDVQTVAEYVPKITTHILTEEKRFLLPPDFMRNQPHISEKMRAYMVDQLAELNFKFKMWTETFYVSVGIMDHYLAKVANVTK